MTTPNDSNAPAPDANAPNPGAEPPGAGAGTPYQPAAGAPRKPRATFLDNCMATANGRLLVLLTGATLVIIGSIVAMAVILTALAILLTLSFGVLLTGLGALLSGLADFAAHSEDIIHTLEMLEEYRRSAHD